MFFLVVLIHSPAFGDSGLSPGLCRGWHVAPLCMVCGCVSLGSLGPSPRGCARERPPERQAAQQPRSGPYASPLCSPLSATTCGASRCCHGALRCLHSLPSDSQPRFERARRATHGWITRPTAGAFEIAPHEYVLVGSRPSDEVVGGETFRRPAEESLVRLGGQRECSELPIGGAVMFSL